MNAIIDSKKILWFDLGYTLLYLKIDRPMQTLLKRYGFEFSLDRIRRVFHQCDKYYMREHPGILGRGKSTYMPGYLKHFIKTLDLTVDSDAFINEWLGCFSPPIDMWEPFPCVRYVLETLAGESIRLGIITNWDTSARPILEKHDLARFFDPIIVSSESGMEKPGREIFLHALSTAGVSAAESLYVGDNYYDDTLGARSVGMDSIIINRFGRLGVEEISDAAFISDIRYLIGDGECRE